MAPEHQADRQPWQNGMDFDRGEFVANLPKGEESLIEMIEELRTQVEQVRNYIFHSCPWADAKARLLSYRLALAEKQMDRRLDIAKQRNAQVGFVKEILSSSNRKLKSQSQLTFSHASTAQNTINSISTRRSTSKCHFARSSSTYRYKVTARGESMGDGPKRLFELGCWENDPPGEQRRYARSCRGSDGARRRPGRLGQAD